MIPPSIEYLLAIATDSAVTMEARMEAKVELRERGWGAVLTLRINQHIDAMKDVVRERVGPEIFSTVERAVDQAIKETFE